MKIICILLCAAISTSCVAASLELEKCGIDIEKPFYNRDSNIIEFLVTIDSESAHASCKKIRTISVGNYLDDEWIMFPLSDRQGTLSLRLQRETAENTLITFFYETDTAHQLGDEKNQLSVKLVEFFD